MKRAIVLALGLAIAVPAAAQADEYLRAIRSALTELAHGEVQAGRDRLSGLVRQSPQRTEAHCHLGSAHRLAGELEPALAAFRECARLGEHSHQKTHQARGLLGIAQVLAQLNRLSEAKDAYAALLTFAEANTDVLDPALVVTRQEAIDAIIAADAAAREIRERREQRARENADAEAESSDAAEE